MDGISRWIADSAWNNAFEAHTSWLIPTLQIIHILSIAIVISSVIMVHGRMLRSIVLNQTIPQATKRFLPPMWVALVLLLLSGLFLMSLEPVRTLGKDIFWFKMIGVTLGVIMTAWLHSDVVRRPDHWSRERFGSAITMFAVFNIGVWIFVIIAGRWIAYA